MNATRFLTFAARHTVCRARGVRHALAVVHVAQALGELLGRPTPRRAAVAAVRTGALVSPRVDRLLLLVSWLGRRGRKGR
jgi:hypothetical protein